MALKITEIFGYAPGDASPQAVAQRAGGICPFTARKCIKTFRSGGTVHGTCTVQVPKEPETICCPNRLYADRHRILRDAAEGAFGPDITLIWPSEIADTQGTAHRVAVFGELPVPRGIGEKGNSSSADWILALLSESAELLEFIPIEVQSIDTTGSYQAEWCRLMGLPAPAPSGRQSNLNWENVNKRIIPQLLTKGNVFRGESLCRKGLFFITAVQISSELAASALM